MDFTSLKKYKIMQYDNLYLNIFIILNLYLAKFMKSDNYRFYFILTIIISLTDKSFVDKKKLIKRRIV